VGSGRLFRGGRGERKTASRSGEAPRVSLIPVMEGVSGDRRPDNVRASRLFPLPVTGRHLAHGLGEALRLVVILVLPAPLRGPARDGPEGLEPR
jgi:hypothetical protein